MPDTIQDPWARACPELGYRLARPALATGPHAQWQKARLWGSQAYVFRRGGLEVMLGAWDRHTGGQDARAVTIAASAGWPLWFSDPCRVEHAPVVSAFGTPPAYERLTLIPITCSHYPARTCTGTPEGVPGWLSYAEGRSLWELARDRRVLELGRFHGRSTVALAQSAREVVSVDVTDPAPAAGWLARFGVADRVTFNVARSRRSYRDWANSSWSSWTGSTTRRTSGPTSNSPCRRWPRAGCWRVTTTRTQFGSARPSGG